MLAAVACLSAFVRLYRLDLTWFFLDQVRDASLASGITSGGALPLLGPRIGWTDAYLGPLYFYLMAIPFSLAGDPAVGVAFLSLSDVLAVVLLYRLVEECFGAQPALYASALFAVFPLAVFSSRLVWHTGLLPLATVLLMRSLYSVIVKGRSWAIIPTISLLAVVTQLHFSSVASAVVVGLALLLFRPSVRPLHALIGAGGFFLLYAPYLAWELSHRFANVRAILRAALGHGASGPGAFSSLIENALLLFRHALEGFSVEAPGPPHLLGAFWALYAVEALAFNAGVLLCLRVLVARRREATPEQAAARRASVLLLLWLAVPLVMLGSQRGVIWWYYLDSLYPSQFIFAAIALSALPRAPFLSPGARRWLGRAAGGLVLLLVASQACFLWAFQQTVLTRGTIVLKVSHFSINGTVSPFDTLSSVPLRYRRAIVRALVEDFGLDVPTFRRRVHGPVLGLPDESEYLVRQFDSDRKRSPGVGAPAERHYVVDAAEAARIGDGTLRSRRIGPYAIVEYVPHIDYQGWRFATATLGALDHVEDQEWRPVAVPTVDVDLALEAGKVAAWSGHLTLPATAGDVRIAIRVVGDAPFSVLGTHVGGRELPRVSTRVQQTPLMLRRPSGWMMGVGWAGESVFELKADTAPVSDRVVVQVAGQGQVLGFDVYEVAGR